MQQNQESNPETILMAVIGMSPAVLTETIWALAREGEPVIPQRVIVLTTTAGRSRLLEDLFQRDGAGICVWDDLRQQLEQAGHSMDGRLRFGSTGDDIRVITALDKSSGRSRELDDLRDAADNEAAADFLLDQVRGVTANPDTRLIASMAGGRKTMGALLYACMTLAGREADRLTHVLINPPYDSLKEFFFPGQSGFVPPAGADGPCVGLADVPFVPLRNLFHRELGRAAGTFSQLVASCSREIRHRAAAELRIEIPAHRSVLRVNHAELALSGREHFLMRCLARHAKNGLPPVPSYGEALDLLAAHAREWDEEIESGRMRFTARAMVFEEEQDIRRVLSDLRKKLRSLGHPGAVLADSLPVRGRFSLDLPGELIHLS
jgi:CRISPR-associated protein (TIGR02584 family)